MHFTVTEVAEMLNVSGRKIQMWIKSGGLPANRINNQYRVNRIELLEWAISRNKVLPAGLTSSGARKAAPASFADALRQGGIVHFLGGTDKASVLRAVIDSMNLPTHVDREFLLHALHAREALGSTALGDGIAIPHLRNPIVLQVQSPLVSLCFLANPIEFGSADGKPVHTLFTLVSPTVRDHAHQLARLALFLRDEGFRGAIERRAPADEVLRKACLVEPQISARDHQVG